VHDTIQRINHYPVDSAVCFANTYPLDSALSGVFIQPLNNLAQMQKQSHSYRSSVFFSTWYQSRSFVLRSHWFTVLVMITAEIGSENALCLIATEKGDAECKENESGNPLSFH